MRASLMRRQRSGSWAYDSSSRLSSANLIVENGENQDSQAILEEENFDLKLRIYHLEQKLNDSIPVEFRLVVEENINLRTQLDSANTTIQKREVILVKARDVIENLQTDLELQKASSTFNENRRNSTESMLSRGSLEEFIIHEETEKVTPNIEGEVEVRKSNEPEYLSLISELKTQIANLERALLEKTKEFQQQVQVNATVLEQRAAQCEEDTLKFAENSQKLKNLADENVNLQQKLDEQFDKTSQLDSTWAQKSTHLDTNHKKNRHT
eukprot:TRINITY_DN3427_c0_g1_i1.p1 TRINITY_DN3427_c0_g1~~TRINITY_DN3427_c0_g1_i1.p1  ORF type:complete len:268 (+),score=46.22 TRINITY_DN3427_c0_g1_i1:124-927(+)